MLTEDRVRELLALAADTIDVAPGGSPRIRRRRLWVAPIAAAAALLVLAGGLWLVNRSQPDRVAVDDSPTLQPQTDPLVLVPPVLGDTVLRAKRILERQGYDVTLAYTDGCVDSRVVALDPAPGTALRRGGAVRLTYESVPENVNCASDARAAALEFVDWALGRGPRPPMTPTIHIAGHLVGTPGSTLTPTTPVAQWPSVVSFAKEATSLVPLTDHRLVQPTLSAAYVPCMDTPFSTCLTNSTLRMTLSLPPPDGAPETTAEIDLYLTSAMITGIGVPDPGDDVTSPMSPPAAR